jgi:hypothetical protein
MAGKKGFRLKNLNDVTRFLKRVINGLYRDEIDSDKAGKLGYLGNILIKAMEQSDLEKRIKVLEDNMNQRNLRAVK